MSANSRAGQFREYKTSFLRESAVPERSLLLPARHDQSHTEPRRMRSYQDSVKTGKRG